MDIIHFTCTPLDNAVIVSYKNCVNLNIRIYRIEGTGKVRNYYLGNETAKYLFSTLEGKETISFHFAPA